MQSGLNFFQIIPTQGWVLSNDVQKVAVKLPEGKNAAGDFTELMRNLMKMASGKGLGVDGDIAVIPMDDESMNDSVEDQLESGTAVIDLTGAGCRKEDLLSALIERMRLLEQSAGQTVDPGIGDAVQQGATAASTQVEAQTGENSAAGLISKIPFALGEDVETGQNRSGAQQRAGESAISGSGGEPVEVIEIDGDPAAPKIWIPRPDAGPDDLIQDSDGKMDSLGKSKIEIPTPFGNTGKDAAPDIAANPAKQASEELSEELAAADDEVADGMAEPETGKKGPAQEKAAGPKTAVPVDAHRIVDRDTAQNSVPVPKPQQTEQQESKTLDMAAARQKPADNPVAAAAAAGENGEETSGNKNEGQQAFRNAMPETLSSRPQTAAHGTDPAAHAAKTDSAPSQADFKAEVIRQIVDNMTLKNAGRQNQMQIRLKPDFLGNVRLQVITENHHVTVRMTADSMAVKDMIEQNVHVLKNELQQHGLEIQKFDVFVGQQNDDNWRQRQQQDMRQQHRTSFAGIFGGEDDAVEENGGVPGRQAMRRPARGSRNEVDFFA